MNVDILYFEGCPNSDTALDNVRAALASEGVEAEVSMVLMRNMDDMVQRRFLGSPTVLIDGEDAEIEARERSDYGFMCRTYCTDDGTLIGAPPVHIIGQAIRDRTAAFGPARPTARHSCAPGDVARDNRATLRAQLVRGRPSETSAR